MINIHQQIYLQQRPQQVNQLRQQKIICKKIDIFTITKCIFNQLENIEKLSQPKLTDKKRFQPVQENIIIYEFKYKNIIYTIAQIINNGIQASTQIMGEQVIFMIGKTGAGKTMLANFLNRKKIKVKINQSFLKRGYTNVHKLIIQNEQQGFKVGHTQASQTKYAAVLDTQNFKIVDTVGLNDTNGTLHQIANLVGLQKALHNAQSVKMILVIHQASIKGDARKNNLVDLVKNFVGFLKNISIDQFMQCATIVITHPSHPIGQIVNTLRDIYYQQKKNFTSQCTKQQQNILKFLYSMIMGAEGQQKIQNLNFLKQELFQLMQKQKKLEQEINDLDLQAVIQILQNSRRRKITLQEQILQQQSTNEQRVIVNIKVKKDLQIQKSKFDKYTKSFQEKTQKIRLKQIEMKKVQQQFIKTEYCVSKNEKQNELYFSYRKKNKQFYNFIIISPKKLTDQRQLYSLIQSLKRCPKIKNTKEAFKISLAEVVSQVQNILYQLSERTFYFLDQKQFLLVQKCLEDMIFLIKNIENDNQNFNKIKQNTIQKICNYFISLSIDFKKTVDISFSMRGGLSISDVNELTNCYQEIKKADELINKLEKLGKSNYSSKDLKLHLQNKYKQTTTVAIKIFQQYQQIQVTQQNIKKLQLIYVYFGDQFSEIQRLYFEFAQQFKELISEKITKSKYCFQNKEFSTLLININFLHKFQTISNTFFGFKLQQVYENLIEKTKKLLQNIFIYDFKNQIKQLTKNSIIKASQTYKLFKDLRNINLANIYLGEQYLKKITKEGFQLIQKQCELLIQKSHILLTTNKHEELENPLVNLKLLRIIEPQLSSKTSDGYFKILSKLQCQICQSSKQKLQAIIQNIQQVKIGRKDVVSIRNVLQKLQKMKWLQSILQKNDISKLITLMNQTLNNTALKIIDHAEKYFKKGLLIFQDNYIRGSKAFQIPNSKLSFYILNNAISFMKNIIQIRPQLKPLWESLNQKVLNLVKQQCHQSNTYLNQLKKEDVKIHIKLDKIILKLFQLKNITEIQSKKQIEKIIATYDKEVRLYFDRIQLNLKIFNLKNKDDYQKFHKFISINIKILKSLIKCCSQLRFLGIQLQNVILQFKNIIYQKFQDLSQQIQIFLEHNDFTQSQQKIQILKLFKNTIQNEFLDNILQKKYQKCVQIYKRKVFEIPNVIKECFKQTKIKDVIDLLNKSKTSLQKQTSKHIAQIQRIILHEYQILSCQIKHISDSTGDKKLDFINKQLRKFNMYKQLSIFIPKFCYNQRRKKITTTIKDYYQKQKEEILHKINVFSFKSLKNKIQHLTNFLSRILMNITEQDYQINPVKFIQRLTIKINDIKSTKIQNNQLQTLTKDFSIYEKILITLKDYDNQFDKQESKQYKKSLIKYFLNNYNQLKKSIQIVTTNKKYDQLELKYQYLREKIKDFITIDTSFIVIQRNQQQIQQLLETILETLKYNGQYTSEYLDKLRKKRKATYKEKIRQILIDIQQTNKKKQQAIKLQKYKNLMECINHLKKFIPLKDHIKQLNLQISLKKTISQVNIKFFYLGIQIQESFKQQNFYKKNQFKSLKQYFDIIEEMQQKILSQQNNFQIKSTYQKIILYINKYIPYVSSKHNFKQLYDRATAISKQQTLIQIVKDHIRNFKKHFKNKFEISAIKYSQLVSVFNKLQDFQQLKKIIDQNMSNLPQKIQKYWQTNQFSKITDILKNLKRLDSRKIDLQVPKLQQTLKLQLISLKTDILRGIDDKQFQKLNEKLNKLIKIQEQFKNAPGIVPVKLPSQQIIMYLQKKIRKNIIIPTIQWINKQNVNQIAESLIDLKKWGKQFLNIENQVNIFIQEILTKVKIKKISNQLGVYLRQISLHIDMNKKAAICAQILHQYSKQLQLPRPLPQLTLQLSEVFKLFSCDKQNPINVQQLKKSYSIFQKQYNLLRENNIEKSSKQMIPENLAKIKLVVKAIISNLKKKKTLTYQDRKDFPKIIANLFIYYSILKSAASYFDIIKLGKVKNANQFLLQPHPIQILSILRFIGCDKQESFLESMVDNTVGTLIKIDKLPNHLMEIITGQGKSIILGIMSLLLALMGYQVSCVCYSKYLSSRDLSAFVDIFKAFDVDEKIIYETFSKICQRIINQKGNIRQKTERLFTGKGVPELKVTKNIQKNRILLIDEVDTFFSKQFYGNTYNIGTTLQHVNITKIIKYIYKNKHKISNIIQEQIKQLPEYKQLQSQFDDCIRNIDNQFQYMIQDLNKNNNRDYVVQKNKIGYKQFDGISYTLSYRYETMFLYMKQNQNKKISNQAMNSKLGVSISCGQYSYAQVVQTFNKIFGVTGTLSNLNLFQKQILSNYQIKSQTFVPSVYGKSKRDQKGILIQNTQSSHYLVISEKIKEGINNQRAVLVFFQNQQKLFKFSKTTYAQHFKNSMQIVTEKSDYRDALINSATKQGMVTLFTASFGRGTDFVVYDPLVKKNGVDVIQTFLSEQKSQQVQIKGRTARQGSRGSYQMILNLQQLKIKYGITQQLITKVKQSTDVKNTLENLLQKQRQKFNQKNQKQRQKSVQQSKNIHNISISKRDLLFENKLKRSDSFFFR